MASIDAVTHTRAVKGALLGGAVAMIVVLAGIAWIALEKPKTPRPVPQDRAVVKPAVHTPILENVPLGRAPVRGPKDALVTVVEISDLACAFCARAHSVLAALETKEPKDVRFAWRSLGASTKRETAVATEVLLASDPEKFWALKKALDDRPLEEVAKSLALEVTALRKSGAARAAIEEDRALAKRLRIDTSPTFFINGERVEGNAPLPVLEAAVRRAKARAGAIAATGIPREQVYEYLAKSGREQAEAPRKTRVDEQAAPQDVPGAPVRGAPDPKVRMIMFVDFESPYCSRANETVKQLLAAYPQLAVEIRHAPAQQNLRARAAAKAALAAEAQGAYWRYHDLLLANVKALSDTDLVAHARTLKLDLERFDLDRHLFSSDAVIDRDLADAERLGVRGTPVFYVGGSVLRGAQPLDAFKPLIEAAIQR